MSGYWYDPNGAWNTEDYDFNDAFTRFTEAEQQSYPAVSVPMDDQWYQQSMYVAEQPPLLHQPQPPYSSYTQQALGLSNVQQESWPQPQLPQYEQHQIYRSQSVSAFPPYADLAATRASAPTAEPSTRYLSPEQAVRPRPTRTHSAAASIASSGHSLYSDVSRSASPSAAEMSKWGMRKQDGTWRCSHPGCTSRSTFTRGCDLRKHYKRHTKSLFCRQEGCPQASEGGFSSRKDRARHEAKHNPAVRCEWEDCPRIFSRVDNMV